MSNGGVYRALFLKNTTFQLRQVKTNVFQVVWIILQMGILVAINNIHASTEVPPPYVNTHSTPFFTPSPYYSGLRADNWWNHIYYVDSNNIAAGLLDNMGHLGRFVYITGGVNSTTINTTVPYLTSADSVNSIFNTYTNVTDLLRKAANENNQDDWNLVVELPTASLEFQSVSSQEISYTVGAPSYSYYYGYTSIPYRMNDQDDVFANVQNTIMNAFLMNVTGLITTIQASSFEYYQVLWSSSNREILTQLVGLLGLFFIPSVVMFIIPVFVYTIVTEKQERIVEMMKMMGISMPTYWIANYTFSVIVSLIMATLVILVGVIGQIPMFSQTEPMTYILLLVLNCFAQVSFSFFLSTFFSKARTSVLLSYFFVMIFSGLGATLQMIVFKTGSAPFILLFFPPFALQRGIYLITYVTTGPYPRGLISLSHYSQLSEVLVYLFFESIVFFILAIYLDLVLPRENGVSYSPFFPIYYFTRRNKSHNAAGSINSSSSRAETHGKLVAPVDTQEDAHEERKPILSPGAVDDENVVIDDIEPLDGIPPDDIEHHVEFEDEDCLRERRKAHMQGGDFLVKIIDLHKTYPGRGGQPAKNALVKFCLALESGECLGLLGPNGAGKTSLISLLCGLSVPTSGNAFISGFSIKDEMYKVHQILGYCPQHDILWQDLTIEEHLLFYCRLKGYNKSNEVFHVREIAGSVGLGEHMHKKVSELSGGMKRRLSISIALVGDSRLVLLDEPTTGLDPDTRRNVWDIINFHKAKRSIIITTHNIDEADVLCSKIAIMSLGSLKCIGTALYLKNKFGAGYKLSAHVAPGAENQYKEWVKTKFTQAEIDPSAGTIDFIIPASDMDVSYVFSIMKQNKDKLGVLEWAINQMSLEEVFLKMVAQDESQF